MADPRFFLSCSAPRPTETAERAEGQVSKQKAKEVKR